jgi:hypothetical protein
MSCARCGSVLRVWSMSRFNTDVLCMPCVEDERLAPGYASAAAVELAHVRDGDLNFPGVGLLPQEAAVLGVPTRERPPVCTNGAS